MTTHSLRVIRSSTMAVLAGWLCAAAAPSAHAFTTSDGTAGYLVFPKVVVERPPGDGNGMRTDTLIQLSNVSDVDAINEAVPGSVRFAHCFYVDGRSCAYKLDFDLVLTRGMPTSWRVSEGRGEPGQTNYIPPLNEQSFLGEVKCVEVADLGTLAPAVSQDLKGEATILRVSPGDPGSVDASSYNAVGFRPAPGSCVGGTAAGALCASSGTCTGGGRCTAEQKEPPAPFALKCISGPNIGAECASPGDSDLSCAKDDKTGECASVLCLGSTAGSAECATATHDACAKTVVLNNFFDDAYDPVAGVPITTHLTFVPCTESLPLGLAAVPSSTVIQFVIFNEFEQRMSAGTRLQCYKDIQLSRIDSQPGYEKSSIFNVAVQGTLAGQTRMAAVAGAETNVGRGFIAVAEEFRGGAAAAFSLNEQAIPLKGDFVRYQAVQ